MHAKGLDTDVQLVVFRLGQEEYGVSILQVQEIKRMTDITRVPHAPDYVTGVINLRGSVLPVLDIKKRLGLQPLPFTDDTRIIIVKVEDILAGMIVDAVSEVLTISNEDIEPPQTAIGAVGTSFLSGVGKINNRLLIILNLNAILGVGQELSR